MIRKFLFVAAMFVAAAACSPDVESITAPDVPEPVSIAGAWSGAARWSALQGGAATVISSQDAAASIFQNGATFTGTWEITGLWVGDVTGNVDPDGNMTGTMAVTVLPPAVACSASATAAGFASAIGLELRVSYANPGSTPCAAAPVGLILTLGRQ